MRIWQQPKEGLNYVLRGSGFELSVSARGIPRVINPSDSTF